MAGSGAQGPVSYGWWWSLSGRLVVRWRWLVPTSGRAMATRSTVVKQARTMLCVPPVCAHGWTPLGAHPRSVSNATRESTAPKMSSHTSADACHGWGASIVLFPFSCVRCCIAYTMLHIHHTGIVTVQPDTHSNRHNHLQSPKTPFSLWRCRRKPPHTPSSAGTGC